MINNNCIVYIVRVLENRSTGQNTNSQETELDNIE